MSSSDPRRSAEAERLKPEARHSADRLRAEAGAAEGLESEVRTAMEERAQQQRKIQRHIAEDIAASAQEASPRQ
ncbi:hypothetical protein ACIQCD_24775 [Streptomyces sp. NPDC093250]|uniref:hypothetical protein n=1 Tax=Streptomyces sp. NPDC093250 TaxID=3366036 RepID=UPI00381F8DCC